MRPALIVAAFGFVVCEECLTYAACFGGTEVFVVTEGRARS
jgi:hypothetical protein